MTENKVKTEKNTAPETGAVILAAGYSSRMKKFKSLLPVGGMSAVERVISCAQKAGIKEIVLVTGYRRELLEPVIRKYGIREAYNTDFDKGMFSSIQAGTRAMDGKAGGFFLMPVDCPAIRQDIFDGLAARAESIMAGGSDRFMVPCYMGKKGHPLFVPSAYFSEILAHDGTNGLKGITDKYDEKMDRIEVESESVILDMDDEAGYREVCAYVESGCRETPLSELAAGHRFILLRHGQIRQHKEKIFLGQTDVPLSDLGRQQAAEAGKRLKSEGLNTNRIYTSDLSRALETAQIVADIIATASSADTAFSADAQTSPAHVDASRAEAQAGRRIAPQTQASPSSEGMQIITEPGFREMALGAWDGRYISEIKAEYPEAYERRGRDIQKFKFDHNSENFYDLRYRVLKTLKEILKVENARIPADADNSEKSGTSEAREDIFIVAHKGVIRVIIEALECPDETNPEACLHSLDNGEFKILSCR